MAERRYFGGFKVQTEYENHSACHALLDRLIEFCECNEEDHRTGNLTKVYAFGKIFRVCSAVAREADLCGYGEQPEYGTTIEDYEEYQ